MVQSHSKILYYNALLAVVFFFLSFYTLQANDRPSAEWRSIEAANFILIYPDDVPEESARALALKMDHVYTSIHLSLNPDRLKQKNKKLKIVLNTRSTFSNGYVTMAPYHSLLYTQPYQHDGLFYQDWMETLAIHELRHSIQFELLEKTPIPMFLGFFWGEEDCFHY